jgi:hypothetical protein
VALFQTPSARGRLGPWRNRMSSQWSSRPTRTAASSWSVR